MRTEKVLIKKESLNEINLKLEQLKLLTQNKDAFILIDEVMEIINKQIKLQNISLEEMIKYKMNETRHSNPELHFKLYKLYRKLVDNKITEEEALDAYKIYLYE
ncbi:hypothetical protein IAI10_08330 [Clostridium sp. 19966]|uniref:hypothetical protein n=1 Tax=Clostridium sp. 19966 TaxID=2768166 RepID=UPI0028E0795E|nr:hypothetical protein [Clostridium sp. 19966]MDT8716662.1 hypothetical protein [Clostridium sp. 19966]